MRNRVLYKTARLFTIVIVVVLSQQTAAADDVLDGIDAYLREDYDQAFHILAPAATTENPQLQNLVGVMLYEGWGTPANSEAAHDLFHYAAALGVMDARRNLGILHSIGAPGVAVNYREARMWFEAATTGSDPTGEGADVGPAAVATTINVEFEDTGDGKRTYLTYCAGCHGFSGMHFFPAAPSFAMGDRMTKSDEELMQSILRGKGLMPSWEDKLPVSELRNALSYLRELALRTGYGTDTGAYDEPPAMFYIFSPAGVVDRFQPDWRATPLNSD